MNTTIPVDLSQVEYTSPDALKSYSFKLSAQNQGSIKTSIEVSEIYKAIAIAQGEFLPAVFDKENPHFKSKYASFASVMQSIRGPMAKQGLAVLQQCQHDEKGVSVVTRIIHSSGQWLEFAPLCVPVGKKDVHGVGGAITYAKRYALSASLGIVTDDDDDGNSAVASNQQKQVQQPSAPAEPFINVDQVHILMDLVAQMDKPEDSKKVIFKEYQVEHYGALRLPQWSKVVNQLQRILEIKNV